MGASDDLYFHSQNVHTGHFCLPMNIKTHTHLKSDEITCHALAHSALEDQLEGYQVWVDWFGGAPQCLFH